MGFVSATGAVGVADPAEERNTTTGAAHDMLGETRAAADHDHDHDLMPPTPSLRIAQLVWLAARTTSPTCPPAHLLDTADSIHGTAMIARTQSVVFRHGALGGGPPSCNRRRSQRVFRTAVCSVESRG